MKNAKRGGTDAGVAQRAAAAEKYRPGKIKLLIVGEAPPCSGDRYFYFEDVDSHDHLFRYVCRVLFTNGMSEQEKKVFVERLREDKPKLLARLRDEGVFLTDVIAEAVDSPSVRELAEHVPALVERCRAWKPGRIVLVKAAVHDAAYGALKAAGLPVAEERVPFPSSGQQGKFEEAFGKAVGRGRDE